MMAIMKMVMLTMMTIGMTMKTMTLTMTMVTMTTRHGTRPHRPHTIPAATLDAPAAHAAKAGDDAPLTMTTLMPLRCRTISSLTVVARLRWTICHGSATAVGMLRITKSGLI